MDETPAERIREARETRDALRRVDPARNPTPADIARFHELHAEHERKHGRLDRAKAAMLRAEHARARPAEPTMN